MLLCRAVIPLAVLVQCIIFGSLVKYTMLENAALDCAGKSVETYALKIVTFASGMRRRSCLLHFHIHIINRAF